jgi:hypothetical protein
MTTKTNKITHQAGSEPIESELSRLGITRVSQDYFHYKDYKYTDAKDAIAQAKRDLKAGGS